MNKQPRKHHYVPQGYLKLFARKNRKSWQTTVIDKMTSKIYTCNIEDVAAMHDYNRVISLDDEFYWEKNYSSIIETDLPNTLNTLISLAKLTQEKRVILNDDLKRRLSRIVAIQLLRTPTMRERNKIIARDTTNKFIKEFKKRHYSNLSPPQKKAVDSIRFNDKFYRQFELPFINDELRLKQYMECLLARCWTVYRNPYSDIMPFITSDNPVTFYNFKKKSSDLADNGLMVDDSVINFPITGGILLCLYTPTIWLRSTEDLKDQIVNLQCSENDFKYILQTNNIQLKQCFRQAYTELKDFTTLELYLK